MNKEIYPKELFSVIVKYAKRYSEIEKLPLLETIKQKTPIYFFIGNYSWEIDPESKYWEEYEQRVLAGEQPDEVAHSMHVKNHKQLTNAQDWFGCFRYKYMKDPKTGDMIVKIHFKNIDQTGKGPLSHENMQERIKELKEMFKQIKEQYPEVKYVQGGSWLYNYDSYKRLFPHSYTQEMRTIPPKTQNMVIWGQFIDSDNHIKEDMVKEFLQKIEIANTKEDLLDAFHYEDFFPRGNIKDFYEFYGI